MRSSSLRNAELVCILQLSYCFWQLNFTETQYNLSSCVFPSPLLLNHVFIAVNKINIVSQGLVLKLRLLNNTLYDKWSVSINHLICGGIQYAWYIKSRSGSYAVSFSS